MNRIDLKGRGAIVTGGARGIGYACAERLLASGAAVALWDTDTDALERAVAALNGAGVVHGFAVDVTDEAAVAKGATAAESALDKVDILINHAGIIGPFAATWEYAPAEWRRVIEVDLTGAYLCCRAVIPGMIARHYGRIVNIASVAGKEGNPSSPAYSAAKAGLIGFTKSVGKELATSGVIVNCVTPTVAKTDLLAQIAEEHIQYLIAKIPMGRFVETQEIAALVAWLASADCSFTTGGVFDISGGRTTY